MCCVLFADAPRPPNFDAQLRRETGAPRSVLARRSVGRARDDTSGSEAGPVALSTLAVLQPGPYGKRECEDME
jgi:hypothetical protein